MRSFHTLPGPLLALLFALPVLAEPVTPNDPFHEIAVHVPKEPEQPVCCLRPLSPLENTEEEVLLSFEEWKAKRMAGGEKDPASARPPPATPPPRVVDIASDRPVSVEPVAAGTGTAPLEHAEVPVPDAPYFMIPLTDRFNYASTDCSARVHTAHKSAKSTSSILSSKKDRYMLSPCAEKKQYVVVELCDDIRIDTVQLANYEFFSGVFKDFTVSVSKTYTTDPNGWTFAGTYRAQNTRGVQSFHPPTTLGDFYRFIRIDFHSHYGNEYYCPLSLLRVYGLTHLEHWKWDLWESESKQRREQELARMTLPEAVEESSTPVSSRAWSDLLPEPPIREVPITAVEATTSTLEEQSRVTVISNVPLTSPETHSEATIAEPTEKIPLPANTPSPSPDMSGAHIVGAPNAVPSSSENQSVSVPAEETGYDASNDNLRPRATDSLYNTIAISEARPPTSVSLSHSISALSSPQSQSGSSHSSGSSSVPSSAVSANQSASSIRSSPSAIPTVTQSIAVVPPAVPASGGESIYRTIMNRLTALEQNSSLYARFVEEHAASVREMLRRLNEDVGRLEGIGKAQAQMYQRSVSQFERQQRRLELEHNELMSRVSRLNDEVVLEKWLGIAQLCLLLAVLVFMALTRGSRSEPLPKRAESMHLRTPSLRGWGSRTLSLSGDWVNRFRTRSLSPASTTTQTETPVPPPRKPNDLSLKLEFPSQGVQAGEAFPRSKRAHPITGGRKLGAVARPRTPSSARPHFRYSSPSHPGTPTPAPPHTANALLASSAATARPAIQRAHSSAMAQSFSMGTIGPVPKSARRWARTAHLHEVKREAGIGASRSEGGALRHDMSVGQARASEGADVFDEGMGKRGKRRADPSLEVDEGLGDASEGDGWVDTDAEEEESEHLRSS